ncbi:MAG TPA: glycosyltransferase family 39 protein [Chloroflexota bacterium]|nr:glycosyltransferase family 39 protein [Chloroflexota bacterium]
MSSDSIASSRESTASGTAAIAVSWHRVALASILLLAAILDFFQLNRVGLGNTYYAAAVKSMLTSWHNFFFVSLDPGGFVSVDKPPVAFWIQAASARVFGFGGISLMLPQALAGVLSVALLYHLVARTFGRTAGLLAALALAVTPVAVLVNRGNLIESTLVLAMLLACWAALRAAETGRLHWLLLSAFLVGVGFNIKMLEAYLVLPALVLVYLLGAPVRWWTRLWHLVAAGIVLVVVSLSWVTAVDLTPAAQRPYVGSSGNNSELSLALGYNGLGRLTGNAFAFLNGGTSLSKTLSNLSPTSLGFTAGEAGSAGFTRLINAELGGQAGWLLMLAIIGLVIAGWRRPHWPLDQHHQSLVLWGGWLLTAGAFFSVAGFFHAYYLATIAPPVAALGGIGAVQLWRDYRRGGWRSWLAPFVLLASALVEIHILGYYPDWSRWLAPLVAGGTVVAAAALIVTRVRWRRISPSRRRIMAPAALGAGVLALLLTPAIWAEYTVAHAAGSLVPSAGPQAQGGFGFGGGRPHFRSGGRFFFGGGSPPPGGPGFAPPGSTFPRGGGFAGGRGSGPGGRFGSDSTTANPGLVRYLEAHQGHTKFLLATPNAGSAEPFILTTGRPVMALGGFMSDRILTVSQLAVDVKNGTVRYFLLSGGDRFGGFVVPGGFRGYAPRRGGFPGRFGGPGSNDDLVQWVTSSCKLVPVTAYGSVSGSTTGGFAGQQLYDCGAH